MDSDYLQHSWNLGRWAGIPVSLHWTVLLAFPWLYLMLRSFIAAAIGTVAFVFLLVAHEFGHVAVARKRRVHVEEIELVLVHGRTSIGYDGTEIDRIWIAWGGVGAQLLILISASVVWYLLPPIESPVAWIVISPVLEVFTHWNIFVMIVALLPIGPLDGPIAWRIFPMMKKSFQRWRQRGSRRKLSAEERQALEESSERAAAEIIEGLRKKSQ
jgi:Zn-dependent protease